MTEKNLLKVAHHDYFLIFVSSSVESSGAAIHNLLFSKEKTKAYLALCFQPGALVCITFYKLVLCWTTTPRRQCHHVVTLLLFFLNLLPVAIRTDIRKCKFCRSICEDKEAEVTTSLRLSWHAFWQAGGSYSPSLTLLRRILQERGLKKRIQRIEVQLGGRTFPWTDSISQDWLSL